MVELLFFSSFFLVPALAARYFSRAKPHWSVRRVAIVSALVPTALLAMFLGYLTYGAATGTPEECGIDACGMFIASVIVAGPIFLGLVFLGSWGGAYLLVDRIRKK